MTSLRDRKAIIKRAREILRVSPEVRARARAESRRSAAEARKVLARVEVHRMLERERALDRIDQALDELEEVASWLLYGKSRGSR